MQVTELYTIEETSGAKVPLFNMSVSAGLPVDVDNSIDEYIDINELLVKHPVTTFFAKVKGNTMEEIGISNDDIVIFDTIEEPKDGKVVIIDENNKIAIKIFRDVRGSKYIQSADNTFLPLEIDDLMKVNILGVVTKVVHELN